MLPLLCREGDLGLLWWQTHFTSCFQDSFERVKYFGPVSGLGVASAVLDEAHAENALHAVSVARCQEAALTRRTVCVKTVQVFGGFVLIPVYLRM